MSEEVLLNSLPALQAAKTFEELHRVILDKIADIHGMGELTVYDTAVRIGAKLSLEPAVVFLHAGTRIGAKALGLDVSKKFIARKIFPPEFGPLSPAEIEDVLCIYKDRSEEKGTDECTTAIETDKTFCECHKSVMVFWVKTVRNESEPINTRTP